MVACENDRIIGAILCGHDGRRGCLYHVCVHEDYRKQGIGQKMVEACLAALKREHVNKVNLIAFKKNDIGNHFWQGMGWNSVIYFAALSGISPELHEAAKCDGATKFQLIRHIDLPSILPTATILLIMNCGSILSIGFEKAYLLQNNLNLNVSEIISTYVYKVGLINNDMSYSTAIGLFNTLVNLVMLLIVNKTADKLSGNSLW